MQQENPDQPKPRRNTPDPGPHVADLEGRKIHLTNTALRGNLLALGARGTGKTTLITRILAHKLHRKAQGQDDDAIIVIDPHGDLVQNVLALATTGTPGKVVLLDLAREDRAPGINPLDPLIFPDREECVNAITKTLTHRQWDRWSMLAKHTLEQALRILHDFNNHPDTRREDIMTLSDVLLLLEDPPKEQRMRQENTLNPFQRTVVNRVMEERLRVWIISFLNSAQRARSDAAAVINDQLEKYAANPRASTILEQKVSTITTPDDVLDNVLDEGMTLLVYTAQEHLGNGPAALAGNAVVSVLQSAMRRRSRGNDKRSARCLLVCEDFQTMPGVDWEGMLESSDRRQCSLALTTQSLGNDFRQEWPREALLEKVGCLAVYRTVHSDVQTVAWRLEHRLLEKVLAQMLGPASARRLITDQRELKTALAALPQHTLYLHHLNQLQEDCPVAKMSALPPPEAGADQQKTMRSALESSDAYTRDVREVREKIEKKVRRNSESKSRGFRLKLGLPQEKEGNQQPRLDAYSSLSQESISRHITTAWRIAQRKWENPDDATS